MLSKHILQILGLVATAVGAVATIAGKVIDDKRQDSVIDEKVAKALAEQQAKNTSETNDEEESLFRTLSFWVMKMNAASLYVVNLIDEFLQQDIYHCHSSELKKKSCMKWSAIELRNRLCNNNDIPPLMVMEGFREQMSSIASRHPETDIFQIVSVTAEYFIDIII